MEPVKREKMSVFAGTVLASFLLLRCRPDTTYEVDWALKPLPSLLTLLLRFQPFLLVLWCFASFFGVLLFGSHENVCVLLAWFCICSCYRLVMVLLVSLFLVLVFSDLVLPLTLLLPRRFCR